MGEDLSSFKKKKKKKKKGVEKRGFFGDTF
jgi:hypothetical protein